jgi:hypothetical protein
MGNEGQEVNEIIEIGTEGWQAEGEQEYSTYITTI